MWHFNLDVSANNVRDKRCASFLFLFCKPFTSSFACLLGLICSETVFLLCISHPFNCKWKAKFYRWMNWFWSSDKDATEFSYYSRCLVIFNSKYLFTLTPAISPLPVCIGCKPSLTNEEQTVIGAAPKMTVLVLVSFASAHLTINVSALHSICDGRGVKKANKEQDQILHFRFECQKNNPCFIFLPISLSLLLSHLTSLSYFCPLWVSLSSTNFSGDFVPPHCASRTRAECAARICHPGLASLVLLPLWVTKACGVGNVHFL